MSHRTASHHPAGVALKALIGIAVVGFEAAWFYLLASLIFRVVSLIFRVV